MTTADAFLAWLAASPLNTGTDADGAEWSFTTQFPAFIDSDNPAERFIVVQPDQLGRMTQQLRGYSFAVWIIGGVQDGDPKGLYAKSSELSDYAQAKWCADSISSISSAHAPVFNGTTTDGRIVYRLDFECQVDGV